MADLKIYSQLAHLKNIDEFKKLETLSLFRYEGEALNVVSIAVGSSFMMGRWGGGGREGRGGVSKNIGYHGWPTAKN